MIIKKKQMKYSKIIYIFLFALISIITILLISYINSANSFSCDNYNFGLYKNGENILSPLLNGVDKAHGGGYIVSFITKLIDFALPTFLNIHPADFIGKAQGTIQGIIFCITCYIMANTLTIGNKNTLTHFAGYFFTIGVLLFEIVHTNSQYLFFSTNEFYRYIFISLFFLLLWQNIYKLTFNKEKLSNWNIVLTVISSFIIATNLELLIFISYILFFFLILFLIVYKIKKKQLFCKQNKAILSIILTFFIFSIWYLHSDGYQILAEARGLQKIYISIIELKNFSIEYVEKIFLQQIIFWVFFFLMLIIAFIYSIKKENNQKIITSIIIEFSILITMFSLVFCGRTYYDKINFWLSREILIFEFSLLSIFAFFFIVNSILENTNNKKIFVTIILFLLLTPPILILNIDKHFIKDETLSNKKYKIHNYIGDKMLRFYYLRNEIPILPDIQYNYNPTPSLYNYELPENRCTTTNKYILDYYTIVYKNKKAANIGYCVSKNAFEIFYEKGGSFTKSELENIKFSNLLDDHFILEHSDNAVGYENLNKYILNEEIYNFVEYLN